MTFSNVIEVIKDFTVNAASRKVDVEVLNLPGLSSHQTDEQLKLRDTKFDTRLKLK